MTGPVLTDSMLPTEELVELAKYLVKEVKGSLGPQTEQAITMMGVSVLQAATTAPPHVRKNMFLYAHALLLVGTVAFAHNAAVIALFETLLEREGHAPKAKP